MHDPYATGVLVKEHHDRLVANLDEFARDAGIQPHLIWTPLADNCGPEEIEYVRNFRQHKRDGLVTGLCYVRMSKDADPETRMAALAGALVRNFIRARVMTLGMVLDGLAKGDAPDATCLLIPNFFLRKAEGGTIATWQVNALYDLMVRRGAQGQQTVVYASSVSDLRTEYGTAFGRLVESRLLQVSI